MLPDYYRKLLATIVRPKQGSFYTGTANRELDEVIAEIKEAVPHLYHTEESLKERVFFDEPYSPPHHTPRKGFVHPYVKPRR
ncbi:hypothetical protein UFOVP254_6 [uncultured Caudovirales phage]|uniref:Uncharacterized protein n=1 Tax=uncultured Caudovirales phage TaxID=2100421 RepID=A0A6J5LM81_9CAUD|nr:hypothetical protein UFOVP76_47 [uncultured Caudovirales phage]CAB4132859.1 hypothetical protein UFOVP254_6 [uncultured Caudovirales phage]